MPSFCVSCGSPLTAQSGFCSGCGARAVNASPGQPAIAAAPSAGMPVAAKSGALKVVLIVLGVMFVFGVLSVAGMYYTAHRYIKMAESVTGINAGDVANSIRDAANHNSHGAREPKRDGCALLSREEASAILGIEVERVDGKPNEQESGEHCNFFVKPETVEKNLEEFKKSAEALKNDPSSPAQPNQLPAGAEDMIKTYTRGMTEGMGDGKMPYFAFTVERENGKLTYTAFQMARSLSGVDAISGKIPEPLAVGDQAIMAIGDSQMCVVKGRSSITLNLMQVTGGRAKGVSLAKMILPRL
jgi:hypothetical protein